MHYKNGRAAKNGDKIVNVSTGTPLTGILHSANPAATSCNGRIALTTPNDPWVNIGECLHIDDVSKATIPDSSQPTPSAS